jgi:hypothetical protein
MTNSEGKKIALIIFHVIALLLLFVSVTLLLDDIFSQSVNPNDYIDSFDISYPRLLAPIAVFVGSVSWLIIILKWIRNNQLEFYLKSIFFAKSILIPGLILLLIV